VREPLGRVWGEGRAPYPENFLNFFNIKWRVLVHSGAWILNLITCQPTREGGRRLDVFITTVNLKEYFTHIID